MSHLYGNWYEQKSVFPPLLYGYHTPSLHSVPWANVIHIFAVRMKTTGSISLKIWDQTVWMMNLNVFRKQTKSFSYNTLQNQNVHLK